MRCCAVVGSLALLSLHAVAQEWGVVNFDSQHGLPQNSVRDMEMTEEGYLWITTEAGLVRFDGNQMRTYARISEPRITSDRFLRITRCGQDGLVAATEDWRWYNISGNDLTALEGTTTELQLGGECPGLHFLRRAFDPVHPLPGRELWPQLSATIHPLGDGRYALPTDAGVLLYRDTALVGRVAVGGADGWFFLVEGRLMMIGKKGLKWIDPDAGAVRSCAWRGLPVPLDGIAQERWQVSGSKGEPLLRIDRRIYTIHRVPGSDDLEVRLLMDGIVPDENVACMRWLPQEGILVVGTVNSGLYLYMERRMRRITGGPGVGPLGLYAQVPLDGERILTGFDRSMEMGPSGLLPPTIPAFTMNHTGLLRDRQGRIWYTKGDDVIRFAPPKGPHEVLSLGKKNHVGGFLEEADSVWVGSSEGIGYVKDWRYRHALRPPEDVPFATPICLRRGPDGRLWVATCVGLFRSVPDSDVLEPVPGLTGMCVRALQSLGDRMLIGTYGNGMYIWNGQACVQVPLDQRRFLTHVHAFLPDSAGAVWITANQGLFRVMRQGLAIFMQDTTHNLYFAQFGEMDGLGGVEFNGGCDPPYARLPDGTVSFPTLDGLVWFKPGSIPNPYPRRRVLIDHVLADNVPVGDTTAIELPPDYQELQVTLSLAYWGELGNAQIEYRLPGRQDNWERLPIGERTIRFRKLPFGDYRLSVRKVGALGNDDPHVVHLRFTVLPPYYRTDWFYLLCAVGLLSLGYLILRLNAARLRRANLALEANVRARTKELRQANEGLQRSLDTKEMLVSIISHDIVTPLRFIARVASGAVRAEQRQEDLSGSLRDISMASTKLHANAENVLNWIKHQDRGIALRPRNLALNPLAEDVLAMVQEHAASRDIELINEVPLDDIVRSDPDVLSIILQNLVNNAVNHTRHSQVRIDGRGTDRDYRIRVSDTGGGMSPKALAHVRRLAAGERQATDQGEGNIHGLGYVIITELLELLGGHLEVDSSEQKGTRVTLVFERAPRAENAGLSPR